MLEVDTAIYLETSKSEMFQQAAEVRLLQEATDSSRNIPNSC